jgi:endonuclease YncB( thermonuclease family)
VTREDQVQLIRDAAMAVAYLVGTIVGVLLFTLFAPASAHAETPRGVIQVIDGDTIKVDGVTFRLMGFDAPETFYAQCPAEKELGEKAKARLEQLLVTAGPSGTRVLTVSPEKDRWGRGLARLYIGGRNVAQIMISEGLARPYDGRSKRQGWC